MSHLRAPNVVTDYEAIRAYEKRCSGMRKWRSPDAAIAFFFTWAPRVRAPRTRNFYSPEELEAMFLDGPAGRAEDILADLADMSVCFDVLTDEQRLVLSATFGLVAGHRRETRGGEAVYIDDATSDLVMDCTTVGPVAHPQDASKTVLAPVRREGATWQQKVAKQMQGMKARAARDKARDKRGELSYRDIAVRLGWVGDTGRPNYERVQRELGAAKKAVRGAMERRGMLEA